ncbi:MAG: hypothetical protein IKH57_17065 [Clostridia bacterium]|nr:hypothetical protein [Clostridia bacterium]
MKKKSCCCAALILAVLLLSGCGGAGTAGRTETPTAGVADVIESGITAADAAGKAPEEEGDAPAPEIPESEEEAVPTPEPEEKDAAAPDDGIGAEELPAPAEGIDIDLTAMSATMVYSEVYSMLATPENYIGKTVKMNGSFADYLDEATGNYYCACIIRDATACCSQGIEFVLTDDYVYPDDYPEVGSDVSVVGVFDTYMEGENLYCTLRNAVLV